MKQEHRIVVIKTSLLIFAALLLAACNLSRTPPTPIATPTPAQITLTVVPTLFASVTPVTVQPTVPGSTPPPAACPQPPGWIPYTIQTGDTLSLLAQALGISALEIATANCLASVDATIFAGQTIYLPRDPASG